MLRKLNALIIEGVYDSVDYVDYVVPARQTS